MKKNKMMRIASILMVATLITTCAISGTFAKYVTKAEAQDNARVAKWGIIVGTEVTDAFATQYKNHEKERTDLPEGFKAYQGEYTVVSSNDDKLVAPGTSSEDLGGLSATLIGTPEVATRYSLVISDWTDVVLPKREGYVDYTELVKDEDDGTYGYTGTFDLDADYTPVKWDINITNSHGVTKGLLSEAAKKLGAEVEELQAAGLNGFSVSEAKEIMKNYKAKLEELLPTLVSGASNPQVVVADDGTVTLSMDFDPNTEMDYTFELAWAWAFEGPMISLSSPTNSTVFDATTVDQADTYLGNIAAGVKDIVVPEGASVKIAATLTAMAVQID
jgi:hypothetical protein